MKNELKVFKNEDFGEVEVIIINEKEWFGATKIAKILGYKNPHDAILRHCKKDGVVKHEVIDSLGRTQDMKFINEGNLYRLIVKSKLPSAEEFESWVFDEVLPTMRKTGGYISNSNLMVNTYFGNLDDNYKGIIKGLFENIEQQQNQITMLNTENDLLSEKVLNWADRPLINAIVRAYGCKLGNKFGEAWISFKKELAYKHSIQLNMRITNYLNKTGKKTKPKTLDMLHDDELPQAVSTAVALCRDNNVDISEIINKFCDNLG